MDFLQTAKGFPIHFTSGIFGLKYTILMHI